MEITVQPRDQRLRSAILRNFYLFKTFSLLVSFVFFITTVAIFAHDNAHYYLCDSNLISASSDAGSNIKVTMIMLMVYFLLESISIIYEMISIKSGNNGGIIRSALRLNHCLGLVVYIFIQVVYFRNLNTECFTSVFPAFGMHTKGWLLAQIILFYIAISLVCLILCIYMRRGRRSI